MRRGAACIRGLERQMRCERSYAVSDCNNELLEHLGLQGDASEGFTACSAHCPSHTPTDEELASKTSGGVLCNHCVNCKHLVAEREGILQPPFPEETVIKPRVPRSAAKIMYSAPERQKNASGFQPVSLKVSSLNCIESHFPLY